MPTAALPRGETISVLVKDQADFATFATGNFTPSYIYSHGIEEKHGLDDNPLLGLPRTNDRDQTAPVDGLPSMAGQPLVVPVCFNHVGMWLKSLFGAASVTGSADPYTHVFTSGGEVLPEKSIEVAVKNVGGATRYWQYTGILANKGTLDFSRSPGVQKLTLDVNGRSETKASSTGGGTPATAWAFDPALATLATFQIDTGGGLANVADVMSVQAVYDNRLVAKEHMNGTAYLSGYDVADNSGFSGSMRLRFRASTFYDYAVAGTELSAAISLAKSGSRSLVLAAPALRLERVGVVIPGPGGLEQTFNFRAHQSSSAAMLTATLKSLVPSY